MTLTIIERCNKVLTELYKFSKDILDLGKPFDSNKLQMIENIVGYKLPSDFTYILSRHNSLSLLGTEVYGVGEEFGESSLENVFIFEHDEVVNPMFREFLPFSPDGRGNHYCLDLSTNNSGLCPVVFWQHDYKYEMKEEVEICNKDFVDWIKEVLIDWNLEDTNYDGSAKN